MASDETWKKLRYFKRDSKIDKWGDPDAIQDAHLLRLDDFRHFLGVPIMVTHGVKTSGHSKGSYHYSKIVGGQQIGACATDVIIPDYQHSAIDLIFDATRFGFTGIGYYPHWRYKGEIVGGLHLDSRPLGLDLDGSVNYNQSRWMGVMHGNQQVYVALTWNNIMKYCSESELIEKLH